MVSSSSTRVADPVPAQRCNCRALIERNVAVAPEALHQRRRLPLQLRSCNSNSSRSRFDDTWMSMLGDKRRMYLADGHRAFG